MSVSERRHLQRLVGPIFHLREVPRYMDYKDNLLEILHNGDPVSITTSDANDGNYSVAAFALNGDDTEVTLNEIIPSATAPRGQLGINVITETDLLQLAEAKVHDVLWNVIYHGVKETSYLFETGFPDEVTQQITAVGLAAAQSIGTRGLARVDIMLDEQHQPWLLEVNTIPGMTSHSLVPKAALQAGISFAELCDQAVRNTQ